MRLALQSLRRLLLEKTFEKTLAGWRLPDHPLRGSAVTAKLVGLVIVVGVATVVRTALSLGDLYPLKAGALFAIISVFAIGFLQSNHPFSQYGPGNQLTTVRAMLLALVAGLIGETVLNEVEAAAAGASLLVVALDGLDGWLARRTHMASDFGARFDMEVDALLIFVLSILVWRHGKAGAWVLVSGAMRYAFVVGGWLLPWLRVPLPPSRRRQTVCVIQVVGLSLAIMPLTVAPQSGLIAALVVASLCYSFAVDVQWLWQHRSLEERTDTLGVDAREIAR
jgi:phosphatidylglycerophosphate synthase